MKIVDPLKDGISSVSLIRSCGSDLEVVNAARVSYGTKSAEFTERDQKLIEYLLAHAHTSPFEHSHLVYHVKLPIYIARQWMRHRVGVSYNEVSGRYTQVPLEFYTPNQWRVPDKKNKQGSFAAELDNSEELLQAYKKTLDDCGKTYHQLLKSGIAKELARGVLPQCTYTQFVFTCNLISLLHFVRLRFDQHAQWEIQQYALEMLKMAHEIFPASVDAWCKVYHVTLPASCDNLKRADRSQATI